MGDDFDFLMGMNDPLSGGYGDNFYSDATSANGPGGLSLFQDGSAGLNNYTIDPTTGFPIPAAGGIGNYSINPDTGLPDTTNGNIGGLTASDIARYAGGSSGAVQSIIRALGGSGSGSSGGIGSLLSTLLPYLAIAGGGALAYSNQGQAAKTLTDAANNANTLVSGIYGQAQSNLQPYQQAGANALTQMQNMPYQPMAGQFQTNAPGQAPTLTAPGQVQNMTAPVMNFQASAPTLSLGNLGGNRLKRA